MQICSHLFVKELWLTSFKIFFFIFLILIQELPTLLYNRNKKYAMKKKRILNITSNKQKSSWLKSKMLLGTPFSFLLPNSGSKRRQVLENIKN